MPEKMTEKTKCTAVNEANRGKNDKVSEEEERWFSIKGDQLR